MSDLPQDNITHEGIISHLTKDVIRVMIVSKASCASCQVKGACSASDVEEKIIEVKKIPDREYNRGDFVTVVIDRSVGLWAVMFGYVFPLIVIVIALIVLTNIMESEGVAGIIAISLLIPYYAGLYYSRKLMDNNFEFKLR